MTLTDSLMRLFGRHSRRNWGEVRESARDLIDRIAPEYEHHAGPDEYPTAKLPVYVEANMFRRGLVDDPAEEMRWTAAPGQDFGRRAINPDGTPVQPRPAHELDHIQQSWCAAPDHRLTDQECELLADAAARQRAEREIAAARAEMDGAL